MAHPTSGEQFLHERNNDFQKSPEVDAVVTYLQQGGEAIPNAPDTRIAAYLGFLGAKEYVNDGILTGDPESIRRQIERSAVHLTKENAEAYVKFQAKVARELGRGAEVEPFDDEMKMNALRLVRKDQQLQLEEWVGELNSAENNYPDWFKYWVFEQVKRTTAFNEELGKNGKAKGFERRSGGSFALFPELDRASLSLVHDVLQEKLTGVKMEAGYDVDYDPLRALLAEANFGKLYGEAQNYGFKITDELKAITTGSWRDFAQSDYAEDADALSALVRSYRTGWCTAGRETAGAQLETGDFYVWCSTNPETEKDEVPRIAVRMEQGAVAEVRGIVGGKRQELEPELADIVVEKIKDLPGGQEYFKKAEDMKRLTVLEHKINADPEVVLMDDEIRFLYEMDNSIQGFGYDKDPRIAELRGKRGERDHAELARLMPEVLAAQAQAAYDVYQDTAVQLGAEVASEHDFTRLLERKEVEWHENGVMDYLVRELIEKGSRPNLVATPNVLASWEQIRELAKDFGKGQPHETYTADKYLGQYSPAELSGALTDGPLRLSIIPSVCNLKPRTLVRQRQWLAEKQVAQPALGFRVPSMLDSIMYWQTLRARGVALQGSGGDGLDWYYADVRRRGRLSLG